MSEIDEVKAELAATKLLLRQEMVRSEEAIALAQYALESLKKASNGIVLASIKRKKGIKLST